MTGAGSGAGGPRRPEGDEALLEAVREHLERSVAELPARDRARLAAARRRALEALDGSPKRSPKRSPDGSPKRWAPRRGPGRLGWSLATAATLALAAALWLAHSPAPPPGELAEALPDLELLAGHADVDFYRELDFYAWLASQGGGGTDGGEEGRGGGA